MEYKILVFEDAHGDEPDDVYRAQNLAVAIQEAGYRAEMLHSEGDGYEMADGSDGELFEIFPEIGTGTVVVTAVKTANIEVYCDETGPYGVVTNHPADLPDPFNKRLQEWVRENFKNLIDGDQIFYGASMEYEPDGDIVELEKTI